MRRSATFAEWSVTTIEEPQSLQPRTLAIIANSKLHDSIEIWSSCTRRWSLSCSRASSLFPDYSPSQYVLFPVHMSLWDCILQLERIKGRNMRKRGWDRSSHQQVSQHSRSRKKWYHNTRIKLPKLPPSPRNLSLLRLRLICSSPILFIHATHFRHILYL